MKYTLEAFVWVLGASALAALAVAILARRALSERRKRLQEFGRKV